MKKVLVIVGDDFGSSAPVNYSIAEACDSGILTSASLMAGGCAFADAVRAADDRKDLSVGVHVTLCDGHAVLPPSCIPGLVDGDGNLEKNPVKAWLKCSKQALQPQIEMEIEAQFDRLKEAGITPTHVDGHHHLHMHPFVFSAICRLGSRRGVKWIRIPKEPLKAAFGMNSRRRGAMPFLEWAVFGPLGSYNARRAAGHGMRVPDSVYGLSHTGKIDERYLLDIFDLLSGPVGELFTHPDVSTENGRTELMALTSKTVRDRLDVLGIAPAGYGELSGAVTNSGPAWGKS